MSLNRVDRRPRGELSRVLVVDDEADIRELLDLTLARMGLSADCAGTVAEARQFLEQERYKLCLTDMRLPDGEGLEIVRLIGERYGETPVAVITAFGSAENAVAALKAGHNYSSQGPEIRRIEVTAKSVEVECSACVSVIVQGYGQAAKAVHGLSMTRASVPLDRFYKSSWVRVTVVDAAGKRAWSNPYWREGFKA